MRITVEIWGRVRIWIRRLDSYNKSDIKAYTYIGTPIIRVTLYRVSVRLKIAVTGKF